MAHSDFALGRLGGARSRLLAEAGLADLLARPDLPSRVERLGASVWASAPSPVAGRPADLEGVEAALAAAFRTETRRVLGDLVGADRRLCATFFLTLDASSLKGPLRALARGLSPAEATAFVDPSPGFDREELLALAASSGVGAVAERLAGRNSPFAPVVAAHAAELLRPGGLLHLEVALDRVAFGSVLSAARGRGEDRAVLRSLAAVRADLANAAVLLALGGGPEPGDLQVPGGERIDADRFRRLCSLSGAPLASAVAAALSDLVERGKVGALLGNPLVADHVLGRALARAARAAGRRFPLSIAVPCAYVLDLAEELRRVRVLLRGTELGFPPAALVDLLEA
ncbi:MAG TPA: V-type ATPase subunit [Anaeromyxobacteraceae bacterium]|nr:V-type ATPase subunit [Anaeromyxobacteraceae bacterium]